ncbi:MAG: GNAT family N-acetyltransferase [bacterium]|nr:GNAT family N-acetyltransferase [bacterium]
MSIEREGQETLNIQTRGPKEGDLAQLSAILEPWVRDRETGEPLPEEVNSILEAVRADISGNSDVRYVVAEGRNKVIGVMGLKPISEAMRQYALTANPAEIVNAFVDPSQRGGKGVGSTLIAAVEAAARESGYTELLLNSGPRYKDTAWGFYTKIYGKPVAVIKDMYGMGGDAPVWRKSFA